MLFSYYRRPVFLLFLFYCFFILLFSSKKDIAFLYKEDYLCGKVLAYPENTGLNYRFLFEAYYGKEKVKFIAYLKEAENLSLYQEICFNAEISRPHSYKIKGFFDWGEYLKKKDIFLEAKGDVYKTLSPSPGLFFWAANIRKKILASFDENFDAEKSAVLSGVVIGHKKKLSLALKDIFLRSGTMHLLVASGGNVAIVVGFFYFLFSFLGLNRFFAYGLAVFACGVYVLACGLDPPLSRAFAMVCFASVAIFLQRKKDVFQILIVSAFFILLLRPAYLFDAGFQMSFLSVYGIAVGFGSWKKILSKIKNKILSFSVNLFLLSFFAQLVLLGLSINYFNAVSFSGLFANMIAVPTAALILPLGFLVSAFSSFPAIAGVFSYILKFILSFFIFIVRFFAEIPFSYFDMPSVDFIYFAVLFAIFFVVSHYPLFRDKKMIYSFFIPTLVFILLFKSFLPKPDFREDFVKNKKSVSVMRFKEKVYLVNVWDSCQEVKSALYRMGIAKADYILLEGGKPDYESLICLKKKLKTKNILLPLWLKTEDYQQGVWPGDEYGFFSVLWADNKKGYQNFEQKVKYQFKNL